MEVSPAIAEGEKIQEQPAGMEVSQAEDAAEKSEEESDNESQSGTDEESGTGEAEEELEELPEEETSCVRFYMRKSTKKTYLCHAPKCESLGALLYHNEGVVCRDGRLANDLTKVVVWFVKNWRIRRYKML